MSVVNVSKFLGNLIFKKSVQKQTGIMKTINPMEKKLAENKAKFALQQIQKNNNIDINNLSANDLEMLAENIVNPIKNATQTPVKSADILDFRYKRNFAEELADASKKGDFKQMTGIMKVDPKFKEVMESLKASKAADAAKAKMIGPKKLIPDRDVIPYQSPEVQKLNFADKLKRSGLTEQQYMDNIVKKGYNVDDAIYARDFYGDTTDQIIKNANTKGAPVAFADGGVAGLLGERPGYNKGLSVLGFTPEHAAAVDEMDKNFTGSQFDFAAASTKDMVDRASNPLTAVASAVGNVVGRPAYDFVDAAQKYSDKGYQGEFSLSPQGAIDFGKNMLSLGGQFLDEKPGTMMAGALKGGIQSLGTQLGEGIYNTFNP